MALPERARQKEHRIAPVNLSEYPTLVRIWQHCGRQTEALRPGFVWEALRHATGVHAYRSAGMQIIGFVITNGPRLEVVCVAPAYQGQGVGSEMLHFAMDRLGAREADPQHLPPGAWDFLMAHGVMPPARAALPVAPLVAAEAPAAQQVPL